MKNRTYQFSILVILLQRKQSILVIDTYKFMVVIKLILSNLIININNINNLNNF